MARELAAVVCGYGQDVPPVRTQQIDSLLGDTRRALSDYQVHLPVTETPSVRFRGVLMYAHVARNVPHPGFPPHLHMTHVFHLVAAMDAQLSAFVRAYHRIDALMGYVSAAQLHVARRPVLGLEQAQGFPDDVLLLCAVARHALTSLHCPPVLPEAVAVAADFPAYRGFVDLYVPSNGAEDVSCLQTQICCVSLLAGQLMIFH